MNVCTIASGSSGNCIYVGDGETNILVDCGISGKRIENGLEQCGVDPKKLNGILITHEHIDHISGLGVMARRYKVPVYTTQKTIQALENTKSLGDLSKTDFVPVEKNVPFMVNTIQITPIPIWHDAVDPVSYRLDKGEQSVGILTDSGKFDDFMVDKLQGLDVLLIEANHDVHMLHAGSYPYYLKQRILSDRGHLSNESSGKFLDLLISDKLKYVVLCHLSQENNYPDLAYETVRLEVDMSDSPHHASDFHMFVAKRNVASKMITI